MSAIGDFYKKLKGGAIYKRTDMLGWSKSLDRHLKIFVDEGFLKKCGPGLYLCLDEKDKIDTPIDESEIISKFLGDSRFLLLTRQSYIDVGLSPSGLHHRTVYNHKRHGQYTLGDVVYKFRVKPHFPLKAEKEFLLVDMLNNLDEIAAAKKIAHEKYILSHVNTCNGTKLEKCIREYADARAKKYIRNLEI